MYQRFDKFRKQIQVWFTNISYDYVHEQKIHIDEYGIGNSVVHRFMGRYAHGRCLCDHLETGSSAGRAAVSGQSSGRQNC